MLKIKVTAADIRLGKKHMTSNTLCPIGRALRRSVSKDIEVGVDWVMGRTRISIDLPRKAARSIDHLIEDSVTGTNLVKPFEFSLTNKQVKVLKG